MTVDGVDTITLFTESIWFGQISGVWRQVCVTHALNLPRSREHLSGIMFLTNYITTIMMSS